MAKKIEITDLSQPYVAPEGATLAELQELEKAANQQALDLLSKNDDNPSDDDIAQAKWLAAAMGAVKEVATGLEQAEQERKNLVAELKSGLTPADPQADADVAGQVDAAAPADAAKELAVVAGGATTNPRLPSVADIAAAQGRPAVNSRPQQAVTLTAAADVPGFVSGTKLQSEQLGDAFEARAKGYASLAGKEGRVQNGFATVRIDMDEALIASGDGDLLRALKYASDESRLDGGSLTAAGGWCAPSEVLYPLLDMTSADGLVSVPEIGVARGGVKWTTGPNFGQVYAQGMASLSESQVQGGTTKSAYNVPCPAFQEQRLNADYLFLTADILSQRGYPEMITDFINKAQKAFLHFESGKTISDISAGSTSVDMTSSSAPVPDLGAVSTILGAAELQAMDIKYRSRLALGTTVELILPLFALGIMRSDFMKRQGLSAQEADIADAEINALFANRGIVTQYVYDWQDNIVTGGTGNAFGAASGTASTWPQTFLGAMYPVGTWARAINPVIELSTVYDSTLLATNQYVGLFQEQGRLTINRGFDSRRIKFASNPSGLTSGFVSQSHPAAATPI